MTTLFACFDKHCYELRPVEASPVSDPCSGKTFRNWIWREQICEEEGHSHLLPFPQAESRDRDARIFTRPAPRLVWSGAASVGSAPFFCRKKSTKNHWIAWQCTFKAGFTLIAHCLDLCKWRRMSSRHTAGCSGIGPRALKSPDACNSGASSDVREPISLHQALVCSREMYVIRNKEFIRRVYQLIVLFSPRWEAKGCQNHVTNISCKSVIGRNLRIGHAESIPRRDTSLRCLRWHVWIHQSDRQKTFPGRPEWKKKPSMSTAKKRGLASLRTT